MDISISDFLWRREGTASPYVRGDRYVCFASLAVPALHKLGEKMIHRTIFLSPSSPSGFESPSANKKTPTFRRCFLFGGEKGMTPVLRTGFLLVDRSACFAMLSVPNSHRSAKNSSPNCFLNASAPTVLFESPSANKKHRHFVGVFCLAERRGFEPLNGY